MTASTGSHAPAKGGCVGTFLAEAFGYVALLALGGVGVGGLELLVRVTRSDPVLGSAFIGLLVGFGIYGVVWTARCKPGLYLEHIHGRHVEPDRTVKLGDGAVRRLREAAMVLTQVLVASLLGYGLVWLPFFSR